MREILFCGKRIDNGEWVEGGCYASRGGKRYIITYGVVIHEYPGDAPDIYDDFSVIEVDPSTFSEFTGLTDKNGKKIFEGDIVATPNYNGIVVYGTGCYCIEYGINSPAIDIVMNDFDVYVIGNIHDTPELLEEQT